MAETKDDVNRHCLRLHRLTTGPWGERSLCRSAALRDGLRRNEGTSFGALRHDFAALDFACAYLGQSAQVMPWYVPRRPKRV